MIEFTHYSENQIMVRRPDKSAFIVTLRKGQSPSLCCRAEAIIYINALIQQLRDAVSDLRPWDDWRMVEFDYLARSVQHTSFIGNSYSDDIRGVLRKVYRLRFHSNRINVICNEISAVIDRYFEPVEPQWFPEQRNVSEQLELFAEKVWG